MSVRVYWGLWLVARRTSMLSAAALFNFFHAHRFGAVSTIPTKDKWGRLGEFVLIAAVVSTIRRHRDVARGRRQSCAGRGRHLRAKPGDGERAAGGTLDGARRFVCGYTPPD